MSNWDRIKSVLKPIVCATDVTEATTLKSLHLCPLDLYQFVTDLEVEFGVEISDRAAEAFQTLGEIEGYIEGKLCKKAESK